MEKLTMSNYTKKVKSNIGKSNDLEDKRISAVAEWFELYGTRYPKLVDASKDPVQAILDLMKSHNISVVEAAEASEAYAIDWLLTQRRQDD